MPSSPAPTNPAPATTSCCALTDDATLGRADGELEARGYRTHEFGDSLLIERVAGATAAQPGTSPYGTCQRKYAATTEPTAAPP